MFPIGPSGSDYSCAVSKNGNVFTPGVCSVVGSNITNIEEGILLRNELESEDQQFEKPNFIGEEVTGQVKYYNMMLLKNPYTTWGK